MAKEKFSPRDQSIIRNRIDYLIFSMKRFIPFMLLILAGLLSCTRSNHASANVSEQLETPDTTQSANQDTIPLPGQVPGHVLSKFNYYFPSVNKVEWETEDTKYKATFKDEQGDKSVFFSADGDILSSKTELNINSLPEAMLAYISSKLNGKKMGKSVMTASETGNITYEIETEGKQYIFDGSGNFLRIEKIEGD